MSEASPESFNYEPDENGDIVFRTLYSDFIIHNFEEYMFFVKSIMTQAEVGVMPVYRAGEPPKGWGETT